MVLSYEWSLVVYHVVGVELSVVTADAKEVLPKHCVSWRLLASGQQAMVRWTEVI